ncbi:protein of unknown function [Xenorhabdus bovienii]|uniref:Uncharacterized protein n=1 Tax=Xenorhabdus bovienii TaxID=40576 RepID=A0A0B6X9L6_XENBV|nr:protein of unknown function [Xenorhabdus bovienii]
MHELLNSCKTKHLINQADWTTVDATP